MLIVEAGGNEASTNRVSLLDAATLEILDTVNLAELVGLSEFNYNTDPIALSADGSMFLAVGQTGLFVIDTSNVPEPAAAILMATLGTALFSRRRRYR